MTRSRFVALPVPRAASARLARRIAHAIVAREQGWSLADLAVSRRWRFQVGRSRWTVQAYAGFSLSAWTELRRGAVWFSINFEGPGSASELDGSALVQDLRGRLGTVHTSADGKRLTWPLSGGSTPRRLLAELDRIAQAFGTDDRHRAPPSRARAVGKRLAVVADAVVAHGTWTLEAATVWLSGDHAHAMIMSIPCSNRGRPDTASLLTTFDDKPPEAAAAQVARAEAHGYTYRASQGPGVTFTTFMKQQPLGLRAAMTEARFFEAELAAEPQVARTSR